MCIFPGLCLCVYVSMYLLWYEKDVLSSVVSPPPQPILSASDVNYAGSNVTLNCTALLVMDSELLDETIEFVWKKNLKTVNVSSDSRLSEQAPVKGSGNTYTSVLRLSPSSIIADSGSYSCDVRVVSGANYSQYVSSVAKELLIKSKWIDVLFVLSGSCVTACFFRC